MIDEVLMVSLSDNVKARELLSDGTYTRVLAQEGQARLRSQERFLEFAQTPARPAPAPPPVVDTRTAGGTRRTRKRQNGG
jgi:hypothetical protein